MKNLIFILCFFLFTICNTYAGNTSLTATYPPIGSYNKITITTPAGTDTTCSASTIGLLFMYTDPATHNQSLQVCANVNGSYVAVPALETCFNRFWDSTSGPPSPVCPPGFTQAANNLVDQFSNGSGGTISSAVCCGNGGVL